MKIKLLLLFVILFTLNNSNAQDIQLVNKIVGNGDPTNYYIGHFPVSGSDGLDLHWYGGIRFGDQTSNSVMQITNGNVGIGTTTPRATLDINGYLNLNNQYGTTTDYLNPGYYVYKNGVVSYGMKLQYTGDKFGTMIFGPNQTDRFIGFGKVGNELKDSQMIEFMRLDLNTGNFGIGTTTPTEKLQILGNIVSGNANGQEGSLFLGNSSHGIKRSANNVEMFTHGLDGNLLFSTIINQEKMRILANGNVGIGTTTPDQKLTVKGKIHAEEIIVDLAVPADYVFQKYYTGKSQLKSDYVMPTLAEIESFTKKNHHLPNIPSAQEVQQKGVSLGEMSNVLLQKVEELTLYAIEQNKELERLKKENEKYKSLAERLSSIEKVLTK